MKKIIVIASSVGIVLCLVILLVFYKNHYQKPKPGSIRTITKSALEKVLEISELSTVESTYNAVATAYSEDGETAKYYVSYHGIVKAGIDFQKISIQMDEDKKKIQLILPDSEIMDCYVEPGELNYIFLDKKYDIDSTAAEAYQICTKDLRKRALQEDKLLEQAKDNAIHAIEGLIEPWVQQMDAEYKVEIK